MKEAFVKFVRDLREPVRAQRQEKIREVELSWSADEFASFRLFVMGLHSSEMADVCYALADAQAAPLLEILADYAENEPNLMKIAFQSMEKTSQEARIFLAKKLVASQKADVRAQACKMLGRAGSRALPILEKALADEDGGVRLAAVKAISRGDFKSLGSRILPLLREDDKKVRLAALETAARLGVASPASENDLLSILRDEREDEPARRLAAGILARASNGAARRIMLEALHNPAAPAGLRLAAAESLGAYDDFEAIKAVVEAVDDPDARIAQMAHMSLNRKSSGAFEEILAQILSGQDIRLARHAAELLGGLDTGAARRALLDRLKIERRMPVVNALARAMGKSDAPGSWDALMAMQKKESIDDPGFFAALAEVVNEENLPQYAALFDEVANPESKREILDRLARFALSSPVTPGMRSLAIRVLKNPDPSLHIYAATILAHTADLESGETALVLDRLGRLGKDPQIHSVVRALLVNTRGALAELFRDAPPEACQILAYASTQATSMGENAEELFLKVANWAGKGVPGATPALRGMAALAPGALVGAMAKSGDPIFLIEAWSGLPEHDRLAHRPKFRIFFAEASQPDALEALRLLENIHDHHALQDLADVAFTSRYPDVRKAALSLARGLILAQ